MKIISLDAAAVISNWSRRTWWRRITEGTVQRAADDVRGRAMLPWSAVEARLAIPFTGEDLEVLAKADLGDAEAQNDIGQLFAIAGRHESALYWIKQAAQQEDPDAMQWLGRAYAAGEGVSKDDNLAIMWLAKAAAHGHVIAQAQIRNLRQGALGSVA
jgi:TPR repeat protein